MALNTRYRTGQIPMVRKAVVAPSLAQGTVGGRQRGPPSTATLLPLGASPVSEEMSWYGRETRDRRP